MIGSEGADPCGRVRPDVSPQGAPDVVRSTPQSPPQAGCGRPPPRFFRRTAVQLVQLNFKRTIRPPHLAEVGGGGGGSARSAGGQDPPASPTTHLPAICRRSFPVNVNVTPPEQESFFPRPQTEEEEGAAGDAPHSWLSEPRGRGGGLGAPSALLLLLAPAPEWGVPVGGGHRRAGQAVAGDGEGAVPLEGRARVVR